MPPRYAYWTIIVDNQPTAFRSGSQEELMPTFKRLKAKNDTAVMMWFQIGKLWPSRVDAQEFMHARGEMARKGDERQGGFRSGDRDFKTSKPHNLKTSRAPRTAWTPRGEPSTPAPARGAGDKLDWKPKGEFVPAPKRAERPEWKPKPRNAAAHFSAPEGERSPRGERPDWKSKPQASGPKPSRFEKPEWKPKGSFTPAPRRDDGGRFAKPDWKPKSFKRPDFKSSGDETRSAKPEWKPKGSFTPAPRRSEKPEWKPKGSFDRKPDWKSKPSTRSERPEWKPKGDGSRTSQPHNLTTSQPEKRKWVPKEEYKKSMGIEARRDSKWRPGGEHKDPKQKYKDAKKAKWTKFKQNVRARSGGKAKKPS